MKKVSIVIPALNEAPSIAQSISLIPKAELNNLGYEVEVIVVDNGSEDGTDFEAKKAGAEVVYQPKRGYGSAYKKGFDKATGNIIVTIDADLTYPVNEIPGLLTFMVNEQLDFITTNRLANLQDGAMTRQNKIGNQILALAVRALYRLDIKDPESGMWLFKRQILSKMKLNNDSWPFSHEIKLEACYFNKFRWREVPINYVKRAGQTKLNNIWKVGLLDLWDIIRMRIIH